MNMEKGFGTMNDVTERSVTISDFFAAVKKNLVMVVVVAVVVAVIGFIYTFFVAKESYKSQSTVVVTFSEEVYAQTDDINKSLKLIQTVGELTSQDNVLLPVARKYAEGEAVDALVSTLRGSLDVKYNTSSFLVNIGVVGSDPEKTMLYANDITQSIIEVCNTDKSLQKLLYNSVSVMTEARYGVYNSPNKPLYGAISVVAGLTLGIVVAVFKELFSNRFKSKEEMASYLGNEVVGSLYDLEKFESMNSLVSVNDKTSRLLSYNRLFSNLKYLNFSSHAKTIMVTSTGEDELKSTTVANLACVMAMNNKKVLVVDMDFRRPDVYKKFNVSVRGGITDYLDGNISYEGVIKHTKENVDIITVGQTLINPTVVIESEGVSKLLQEAKQNYDYILIDTPPLLAASDAQAIAKLADGVLYNVRVNKYKRSVINEQLNSLKKSGASILGLNATFLKIGKSSFNYYYSQK